MKPPMILAFTSLLSLAYGIAQASPAPERHHLQPNAPRSVTVSEAQTPPVVRTGLLQSTLILLPSEEKIATVFGGDTVDWVFDAGHVASRFISIKPKLANTSTDIHTHRSRGRDARCRTGEGGVMQTILRILKQAGGWHHGLYLKIENPPYMALVIEATDESGPCGLPAISVCHYSEQNGDLMRDPEMCFELGFIDGPHLSAFYYRNDYVGVEQWSRTIVRDNYVYLVSLHQQHERFAKVWDNNLRLQGFAEAFEQQQQTPRA